MAAPARRGRELVRSLQAQLAEEGDVVMVWCGRDRWCHIALVMDCANREALGWRLSKRGSAATAEAALEEALIQRFGHLGRVPGPLQLRSDNGLVFNARQQVALFSGLRKHWHTCSPG